MSFRAPARDAEPGENVADGQRPNTRKQTAISSGASAQQGMRWKGTADTTYHRHNFWPFVS